MAVSDDIAAVLADDTKTLAEKRSLVRQLRTRAFERLLGDDLERTFTLASGVSVTISDPGARLQGDDLVLRFHLLVLRRSGKVHFEDDVVIVNPPLKVEDGADASGNMTYREDVRAALRQIIAQVAR